MKKHNTPKTHKNIKQSMWQRPKMWITVLSVLVIAGGGAVLNQAAHAAANSLYVAPSGGTYTVGSTISVAVREDSGTTGVYSEQVGLSYPQSLLQYVSIDGSGSAFVTDTGLSAGGSGHVAIIRGSLSPITNDQLIATVNFKVLATGSAAVSFDSACQGTNTANCSTVYDVNSSNVISSTSGGTYTLQAAATPTCPAGQTGTPPNCTTPPATTSPKSPSTPTPTTTPTPASKSSSTAITPQSSLTPIVVPNNSQVQVSTPADVQPATIQPDGVQKILYYLNNKLVYTANAVPYTYHLDTTHLLNGTYTLKSVKYYISGRQDSSTQKLVIKNPFSLIQFGLLLRHYIAEILIPFILIILAFAFLYFRVHRIKWYKGPGSSSIDPTNPSSPTMNVQGPTIVTPTGSSV